MQGIPFSIVRCSAKNHLSGCFADNHRPYRLVRLRLKVRCDCVYLCSIDVWLKTCGRLDRLEPHSDLLLTDWQGGGEEAEYFRVEELVGEDNSHPAALAFVKVFDWEPLV